MDSENKKLKLSSPWITYYRKVAALFSEDPEVSVVFDENECELKIYVESTLKADALEILLPKEKTFGNVVMKIAVIPANGDDITSLELFEQAFNGNPALVRIQEVQSVLGSFSYLVFDKKVVQFFNDQLDDVHGNLSTLYQDIAKEVFEGRSDVFFCTDIADNETGDAVSVWP